MQSYKGVSAGNIELSGFDNCGRLGMMGRIYEEIIYKTEKGDYTYVPNSVFSFYSKEVKNLRKKAPPSQELMEEQNFCFSQEGEWIDHVDRFPIMSDCHYPAKDAGKKCRDSLECQGFCLPVLNDKELKKIHELNIKSIVNPHQLRPEVLGQCSESKNLHNAPLGLMQAGMLTEPHYGELRK